MRKIYLSSLLLLLLTGLISSVPTQSITAAEVSNAQVTLLLPGGGGTLSDPASNQIVPLGIVKKILMQAAPIFGVSFETLMNEYQSCNCTVSFVGPRTYKVVHGGGAAILILDGSN